MAIVEVLTNNTPRYFTAQEKAFEVHYTEGGYLWKLAEGQPESYKPYASGILPASRLDIYELYMVNGRKPTDENIKEAQEACRNSSTLTED